MVSITELHQARKELLEAGASLVFQGEAMLSIDWFGSKNPYDKTDTELALLKESISIWKNNTYNADNVRKVISEKNEWDLINVLDRLKRIKNEGKTATGVDLDCFTKLNRGVEILKWWEEEAQATEKELETATKKALKYEELYDQWSRDGLKWYFDSKSIHPRRNKTN